MGKRPQARLKPPVRVQKPADIYIDYPDGEHPVSPAFLTAYGRADRVGKVIGIVTTLDGAVASVGYTLAEPPFWVIYFRDLPEEADLTLWVFESPCVGRSCIPLCQSVEFSTGKKGGYGQVTISSPGSGATVSTTFSACGTTDQNGEVIADFDGPSGTYAGTVLQGPPNWVVQFSNVNPGSGYTLNVVINGVAAQPPSTNITVQ